MNLKKSKLELLFNFTKATDGALTLAESRARDTFIKPLVDLTQTYLNDRDAIYKEFCFKNEDGTPDLKDGNQYQFDRKNLEEINKEVEILGNEEVDVIVPANLKEILEKSTYMPKIGEAEIIDEILTKI